MTKQERSDEEVSAISRKEMTEYADMGHFSNPEVALPYLIDGHDLGYKRCEKELLPIINQQSEEIEHWKKEAERMQGLYAQMIELDLTRRADISNLRDKNFTTLNDYRDEVKMRLEAQTERDNLLQEIEKLKAEVATVKANDRFRTELSVNNRIITKRRLFEVIQEECPEDSEEVDKISEETLIEAIESYIQNMRVELVTKNDTLQSRFDELVKGLEGMTNELSKNPFHYQEEIKSLITKAKG